MYVATALLVALEISVTVPVGTGVAEAVTPAGLTVMATAAVEPAANVFGVIERVVCVVSQAAAYVLNVSLEEYQPFTPIEGVWWKNQLTKANSCT